MSRSRTTPSAIMAAASATTIQRIIGAGPLVSADAELGAEQLLGADGHDRGARAWTALEDRLVALDALDGDPLPHEGQRPDAGVDPGLAVLVVQHRAVGDQRACVPPGADLGGPQADPCGRVPGQGHPAEVRPLDVLA